MKIYQAYRNWCRTWSRSQLIFLLVSTMIPTIISVYAMNRFVKAREAALYWQEIAIESIYINNDK